MSQLECTLESVSGSWALPTVECVLETISEVGIHTLKVITPLRQPKTEKINNLIDYIKHCDGIEYVQVLQPKKIHTEALKIKALYPDLIIEVIEDEIKISI